MLRYEPFNWYDEPLYYDIIFDADTQLEIRFLEGVIGRYGTTSGRRVLEPACGSGRLVSAMAARGYAVTGFDISAAALRFARSRLREVGLRAGLRKAPMQRFDFGRRFDAAHCLVSTFKYLLDEASARGHLKCVAAALKPGGVYVLGLHLSEYGTRARTRERWVAARHGVAVTCNIQVWPPDRLRRSERVRCRLVVKGDGPTRRLETNWLFRTYSLAQVRSLLRSVPGLEHVATFNFKYDLEKPMPFDGEWLDNVLVLRRT